MANTLNISWGGGSKSEPTNSLKLDKSDVRHHNNEIFFYCGVNSDSINALINAVDSVIEGQMEKQKSLIKEDVANHKIVLYIDSYGGTIKDCFKFIDYINILKANHSIHLTTVCTGFVASAATLIALVGDTRYITKLTTYMLHELSCLSAGNYTHVASQMKYINNLHENIIGLYLKYVPDMTREEISKMLLTETWLTAHECEKLGFAKVL